MLDSVDKLKEILLTKKMMPSTYLQKIHEGVGVWGYLPTVKTHHTLKDVWETAHTTLNKCQVLGGEKNTI